MKRSVFSILFFGIICSGVIAQQTIQLSALYDALDAHHPYKNLSAIAQQISKEQKGLNASTNLPQINLSGQSTWQSEVTSVPIKFPGVDIPTPSKDQYRALLDISQSVFDGGLHKTTDEQINQSMSMEIAQSEVSLYNLREIICKAYFGARMADLTSQQLQILIADLEQKSTRLEAQIKEGISSGYQASVLKVKIKEAQQSIREAVLQKQVAIQTINLYTGLSLDPSIRLDQTIFNSSEGNTMRPEYKFFDAQKKWQIAMYDQNSTKYNPKISAFAQLGYGKPGLNVLSNTFKSYSILGLRAQWNLSNFYLNQKNKEKNILQNNMDKIKTQEEAFSLQQKSRSVLQELEIKNYEVSIQEDDETIALYNKILISSAAQFDNGISTINEYSNDANNLAQAKIKRDVHTTLLNQAKELYQLIQAK